MKISGSDARLADLNNELCSVRVEDIEDPLMQKIRWLDKLIDELAKGKRIHKILRMADYLASEPGAIAIGFFQGRK